SMIQDCEGDQPRKSEVRMVWKLDRLSRSLAGGRHCRWPDFIANPAPPRARTGQPPARLPTRHAEAYATSEYCKVHSRLPAKFKCQSPGRNLLRRQAKRF